MRRLVLVLVGLSLVALPSTAYALTPGPEAQCIYGGSLGGTPTEQPMVDVAITPSSGSSVVGSPTATVTFTISSTSGNNANGGANLVLDVWDSQGNLVDEEPMLWNGSAYAYTTETYGSAAPWTEQQGAYRWVVFNPYTTETTDPVLGVVASCTILYSSQMTFNVVPPALSRTAITSRWKEVVGPHTDGHIQCFMLEPWTSHCSLHWKHAKSSYTATGTMTNFIGPNGADPSQQDGGYFWSYNLTGTRIHNGRRTKFHWRGQRGATNA
jgi:hypothetical protein